MCGLRSKTQQGVHGKRLGQIRQRVKLGQPLWTHPDRRNDDDGELLAVPIYLLQVKTPAESKGEWDVFKLVATLPGEQAFGPLDKACFLVK